MGKEGGRHQNLIWSQQSSREGQQRMDPKWKILQKSRQKTRWQVRREKDAGVHKTEGKRKSNTKPHGSTYKPRYIHTPIKAGKWGTKGVIATSASPVVLPTAVLLVVHQGASGIRTGHSHGAGCGHPSRRGRVPARHPGLLSSFLPT